TSRGGLPDPKGILPFFLSQSTWVALMARQWCFEGNGCNAVPGPDGALSLPDWPRGGTDCTYSWTKPCTAAPTFLEPKACWLPPAIAMIGFMRGHPEISVPWLLLPQAPAS